MTMPGGHPEDVLTEMEILEDLLPLSTTGPVIVVPGAPVNTTLPACPGPGKLPYGSCGAITMTPISFQFESVPSIVQIMGHSSIQHLDYPPMASNRLCVALPLQPCRSL